MWRSFLLGILALTAYAEDLPRGQIIDDVLCAARSGQRYVLYIPSNYSPQRAWPVILAFDPRANGRSPVVQYRVAAETYGFIVAGSKNSRNGPPDVSLNAAQAMLDDVNSRFSTDPKRIYLAGHSGGARFSMDLAMGTGKFAGVFASSAGFPREPQKNLPFPVCGTAGTEDFNKLGMHTFDRLLTSPHHVAIFDGGHTWLPSDLAVEAVEWMEVQAMKSGRRGRDDALLNKIFEIRKAKAAAQTDAKSTYLALTAIAMDFAGLKDVSEFSKRAAALEQQKDVQDALKKDLADEQREDRLLKELGQLEYVLLDPRERTSALAQLRTRLTDLAHRASTPENTPDRQLARRTISATLADNSGRPDPEFQKLLEEIRPAVRR
ncbi:MAG: hypothetical protein ABSB35_22620 [Bryobacteraceae bacterium]